MKYLQALRRDLHAHPELCFQEERTSEVIAATLTGWGIPIHRGLGGTGVVGIASSSSRATIRPPSITNAKRNSCVACWVSWSARPT